MFTSSSSSSCSLPSWIPSSSSSSSSSSCASSSSSDLVPSVEVDKQVLYLIASLQNRILEVGKILAPLIPTLSEEQRKNLDQGILTIRETALQGFNLMQSQLKVEGAPKKTSGKQLRKRKIKASTGKKTKESSRKARPLPPQFHKNNFEKYQSFNQDTIGKIAVFLDDGSLTTFLSTCHSLCKLKNKDFWLDIAEIRLEKNPIFKRMNQLQQGGCKITSEAQYVAIQYFDRNIQEAGQRFLPKLITKECVSYCEEMADGKIFLIIRDKLVKVWEAGHKKTTSLFELEPVRHEVDTLWAPLYHLLPQQQKLLQFVYKKSKLIVKKWSCISGKLECQKIVNLPWEHTMAAPNYIFRGVSDSEINMMYCTEQLIYNSIKINLAEQASVNGETPRIAYETGAENSWSCRYPSGICLSSDRRGLMLRLKENQEPVRMGTHVALSSRVELVSPCEKWAVCPNQDKSVNVWNLETMSCKELFFELPLRHWDFLDETHVIFKYGNSSTYQIEVWNIDKMVKTSPSLSLTTLLGENEMYHKQLTIFDSKKVLAWTRHKDHLVPIIYSAFYEAEQALKKSFSSAPAPRKNASKGKRKSS